MNEDIREKLSAYVDGALTGPEKAAVEAALASDAELRAELEALRAISASVKGLPREPLPPGFRARLEARRAREALPERPYWVLPPAWRPAAFALSCGLLAVMVWDRTVTRDVVVPEPGWQVQRVPLKSQRDAPPTNAELAGRVGSIGAEPFSLDGAAASDASERRPRAEAYAKRSQAKGVPLGPEPAPSANAFADSAAGARALSAPATPEDALERVDAESERARSDFNERNFTRLEKEKKDMGIARVLEKVETPALDEQREELDDARRRGQEIVALGATPEPPPPARLNSMGRSRAAAVRGAMQAGRGGGLAAAASSPPPSVSALYLKSAEALSAAWAAAGLPGQPPTVAFPAQHAVFLICPDSCGVVSAGPTPKSLTVFFKESGFPSPASRVKAVRPTSKPLLLKPAK